MLLWITGLQMVLGIVAYLTRLTLSGVQPAALMVGFTVAHVATGALTMAFSLALGVLVLRSVRAADPSRAPQAARA
jgi:hypothetical protein